MNFLENDPATSSGLETYTQLPAYPSEFSSTSEQEGLNHGYQTATGTLASPEDTTSELSQLAKESISHIGIKAQEFKLAAKTPSGAVFHLTSLLTVVALAGLGVPMEPWLVAILLVYGLLSQIIYGVMRKP